LQAIRQLGLSDQKQCRRTFGAAFGIRQQPQLLEELEWQALRFVDDQRQDAAAAVAGVDRRFHLLEKTGLRRERLVAELELADQELVELGTRQRRIRQNRDPRCARLLRLQRRANQRRLAHPGFADEQRDPRPARQPVAQVHQRLVMLRRQKQKPGMRRQVERPLAKAEVLFVHRQFQGLRAATWAPTVAVEGIIHRCSCHRAESL
jgi:hypothetical protein